MKKLAITEEKQISEIQEEFNRFYPYLKLEFFRVNNNTVKRCQLISKSLKVGDVIYELKEGAIQISDAMTVFELENIFTNRFGLAAQVFRKSGNIWLETTMTDKWTLKNQNDHGREISTIIF